VYMVWQRGRPREVIDRGGAATPADEPEATPREEHATASEDDHRTGAGA
jgi:hypothetical protein